MDEKQLTIKQIQEVFHWSYPTALRFASIHGKSVVIKETNSKKWFIPVSAVNAKIKIYDDKAQFLRDNLAAVLENGANS